MRIRWPTLCRESATPDWTAESAPLWTVLALSALAGLLLIALLTFRDYGVNSDEIAHFTNGPFLLDYYRLLIAEGFSPATRAYYQASSYAYDMFAYSGLVDMVTALACRVSPLSPIATQHLIYALIGILGGIGCWKLARWLRGPRTAFLAILMLTLIPAYYGHLFNNPKDIPFATTYIWSLYYLVRVLHQPDPCPFSMVIRLGLAMGTCMGIRFGGLLLPFYLATALALRQGLRIWRSRQFQPALQEGFRIGVRVALPALVLAYLIMMAAWPWIHPDPFVRPFQVLQTTCTRNLPFISVLFEGRIFTVDQLPPTYLLKQFLIQIPLGWMALFLLWPAGWWITHQRSEPDSARRFGEIGIAGACLFPLLYALWRHAPVYNGFRHFLFILPPACILAATTAARLLDGLSAVHPRIGRMLFALGAGYALFIAVNMALLHPFQYLAYNRLVGGLRGAQGRYELDYYCHSYGEAVRTLDRWIHTHRPGESNTVIRVYTADHPFSSTPFFPSSWVRVRDPAEADYLISKEPFPHRPTLGVVERQGVVLNTLQGQAGDGR